MPGKVLYAILSQPLLAAPASKPLGSPSAPTPQPLTPSTPLARERGTADNTNADKAVGYLTEPRSNAVVSNFTFISKGFDDVFKLKEGVSGQYLNGVAIVNNAVTGLTTNCIETTFLETVQAGAVTP